MRRALFVAPLVALVLVACGDASSDTTITAATDAVIETPVADTEAVATEPAVTDANATEAIATEAAGATEAAAADTGAATAPGGPSFSIVAAVSGTWPSPVPAATKVSDIDTETLCAKLREGGAFGDLEGDYYGGSLSRVEETLQFQCRFRYPAQTPVSLDGFSDAFVAGVKGNGESLTSDEGGSVGLVEVTLTGDLLVSAESGDQFTEANNGCIAAASAVGLTGAWTSETLGSVDGNRVVTCRGPIPNADIRTADPALTSKAVGSDAPPLD